MPAPIPGYRPVIRPSGIGAGFTFAMMLLMILIIALIGDAEDGRSERSAVDGISLSASESGDASLIIRVGNDTEETAELRLTSNGPADAVIVWQCASWGKRHCLNSGEGTGALIDVPILLPPGSHQDILVNGPGVFRDVYAFQLEGMRGTQPYITFAGE